ncbi:MAG: hypothetical protein KDA90_03745 [Planctomycetaceae bacterium]|nr:hypothetical protein [Planctomycetaceae bacterium]
MLLAIAQLEQQSAHLYKVVLGILQPLFFLLLLMGFVLASAHLLTMLGTRWGDRRTSSKALFFSVVVHLLLGGGIISMIPEYRQKIFAHLVELEELPFQIQTPPLDPNDETVMHTRSGDVPVFDRLPEMQPEDRDRFDVPMESAAPEPVVPPENSPTPFEPAPSSDTTPLPLEPSPSPQADPVRTMSAGPPQQATDLVRPEAIPVQPREEQASVAATETRMTPAANLPAEVLPGPLAPRPGSVDRMAPEFNPTQDNTSIPLDNNPLARLQRAPEDDQVMRREGLAPATPDLDPLGIDALERPQPVVPTTPVTPSLTRMQPLTPAAPSDMEAAPTRPAITPVVPESLLPRTESTPGNLDRMQLPLTETPQLARQTDDGLARSFEQIPSAYQLRSDEQRRRALMEYGGSEDSEAAVDRSLRWLASVQSPAGYWDASIHEAGTIDVGPDGQSRGFAGRNADTGVTALAILAFLGKQNTLDQGEYSPQVERGLRWLVSVQRPFKWSEFINASDLQNWSERDKVDDGYLGGNSSTFCGMYCHAMATFSMAEAYAMSRNNPEAQWLRRPLERAVNFILAAQLRDGGWRYIKGEERGDVSVLGWQIMALKSAELAGIEIPAMPKQRMIQFLQKASIGQHGGLAGYRLNDPPSPTMTAEALFCRQVLGLAPASESAATDEAVNYLLQNKPSRRQLNYYYWYYGTLAMYQRGGAPWEEWNTAMRDLVVSEQERSGPNAGSWPPRDPWSGYGGRIYSTAVATLSLEVYYRYKSVNDRR